MQLNCVVLLLFVTASLASVPPDGFTQAPYCKGTNTDEECADLLISKLSLHDKIGQMMSGAPSVDSLDVEGWNWWNEGLHGQARTGWATVFPQAIGMASSWDPNMVKKVGDVISTEARQKRQNWKEGENYEKKGLTIWSPNINILRDPRWGRGQETYGEDPFLTAQFGVHFIQGIQGPDVPQYYKAVATPKHYAAHSGPEPIREKFDAKVSAFDYEDTYTPAFRAAIVDGKAHSIMCSYNALNGVPTCADPFLLTEQLRNYWGFSGYVVSDCDAVGDVFNPHHYTKDAVEAAAVSLKAGTDLDCGGTYWKLQDALTRGIVNMSTIDNSLRNLFLARIKTREAQKNVPPTPNPDDNSFALEVARKSLVLLKNEKNLLPLSKNKKIAVVGPTADVLEVLFANYHGTIRKPITFLTGLRDVFGEANVAYAQGSTTDQGYTITVPETAFKTATGKTGLDVQLWNNPTFSGSPVKTVHRKIQYDLSEPIDDAITSQQWSGRWSGSLVVPAPGKYGFYFWNRGSDSNQVSMWVDDKLQQSSNGSVSFDIKFTTAGAHSFRFEMIRRNGGEELRLQWVAPADVQLKEALVAAKSADVIVACVGLTPDLEGEGYDRKDIVLPQLQEDLLKAVALAKKPVVVVYTGGGMMSLRDVNLADAILHSFYPGESGGLAMAQTLAGLNNPGGKMPVTTYRSLNDVPEFTNYSMSNRTYRFYEGEVQFPFGLGLSYTTFKMSGLSLSTSQLEAGKSLQVNVNVTNSGNMDGDEVVQVYVKAPEGMSGSKMNYWLAAFQRVSVSKGQTVPVKLDIATRSLSTVNEKGDRAVREGDYQVLVANGQPKYVEALKAALHITGTMPMPK